MRAKFECEVTAGFLESGILAVVSLAAWLIGIWYAVRVSIDRSLFRTRAGNPEESADWLAALIVQLATLAAAEILRAVHG